MIRDQRAEDRFQVSGVRGHKKTNDPTLKPEEWDQNFKRRRIKS